MADSIGVAVITHNAKHHLKQCLPLFGIFTQTSRRGGKLFFHRWYCRRSSRLGAETWVIPRSEFNHGTTRDQVRRYLGTDIVVMITPDAYALDEGMIERLIDPVVKKRSR